MTAGNRLFHHIVESDRVGTYILQEMNKQKLPGNKSQMFLPFFWGGGESCKGFKNFPVPRFVDTILFYFWSQYLDPADVYLLSQTGSYLDIKNLKKYNIFKQLFEIKS